MLSTLLGSKSAERILLFLLVNEYACAAEVQKALGIPLTPLQSAFRKLEKAEILSSLRQGKRKLYRFNAYYPLLDELKLLLKKGFIALPLENKQAFFPRANSWTTLIKNPFALQKRKSVCLASFWKRLLSVHSVSIEAPPGKRAFGSVSISIEKQNTLLFSEKGYWIEPQEIEFTNALRWTFDYEAGLISLEHLRYGPARPVFLFHLTPNSSKSFQSVNSHSCREDCYFGRIGFTEKNVQFSWRILGPRKNETLFYIYS